ncbi:S26 family signal peptidase [Streptomyces guryensis]|uniref:S26 family signal peptidase n=1 Tax=Streptomyces guryensis TaxID=2886947 RepID=UPI0027E0FDE3|nr:S26 family signal peptidase [Streptomyces guryensis]
MFRVGRVVEVGGDHIACCVGEAEKVPEGRLFVLGGRRSNSRDSRAFPDDHGGTVPVSAVQGRGTDDCTGLALLGVAALMGGGAGMTTGPTERSAGPLAVWRSGVSDRRGGVPVRRAWPRGRGPWRPRPRCRCPVLGR